MSVNGLKPTFTDKTSYLAWRKTWKLVYMELSRRIREKKQELRDLTTAPPADASESTSWKTGSGCHVCGENHGSAHYFNICAPRSSLRTAYLTDTTRTKRAAQTQRNLFLMRRDATKMMTLLQEAKDRRDRILAMIKDVEAQPFPIEMEADRVDIFYNRASNEFSVLPRWVLKTRGKSFYIDHIDATVPWSTRELDAGPTKGMLRFRKCKVAISKDRIATLRAA
jgi:hypothetical protein